VSHDPCPAFVTVASGAQVRCDKPTGHGPAEDMHRGIVRVTLPDGRDTAASLVWSTVVTPCDLRGVVPINVTLTSRSAASLRWAERSGHRLTA
jgi:hypothetical protein